jgi:predicted ATPase/DNA-binding CsgD family transcriptional regulator
MSSSQRHTRDPAVAHASARERARHHEHARRDAGPDEFDGELSGRTNLPRPVSSFVGRAEDIAALADVVVETPLVTLCGVGGIGKTRLALEVAAKVADQFADGVSLVELANLTGRDSIELAVRSALGVPYGQSRRRDLPAWIGARHLLLVLDNCEHLVDVCAPLADRLLRACSALHVLATSREPLAVNGERVWRVRPLSIPDQVEGDGTWATTEAPRLFLERASASGYANALEGSGQAVVEICRRLDGLPLAIELAVARLGVLSPEEIVDRLDERFRLLSNGSRAALGRHQTLAATLAWSYDLLSNAESALLRRLSVFAGGWTIAGAEAVCAAGEVRGDDILDLLGRLVVKSLVVANTSASPSRYRMLDTIRDYLRAKLDDAGESEPVLHRHTIWCVELAERADAELTGPDQYASLAQLDMEYDNIRAALEWSRQQGEVELGARLAVALTRFWRTRGYLQEGVEWLDWSLSLSGDAAPALRAKALRGAALLRGLLGDLDAAIPLGDESTRLLHDAGESSPSVCTCNRLFRMCRNPKHTLPLVEASVAAARASGSVNRLAHCLVNSGQSRFFQADVPGARQRFDEVVSLGRSHRDNEALQSGLLGLGRVAVLVGDHPDAQCVLSEALVLADGAQDHDGRATALSLFADVALASTNWHRSAAELAGEALAAARTGGAALSVARSEALLARIALTEGDVDVARSLWERSVERSKAAGSLAYHDVRCLLGLAQCAAAVDSSEARRLLREAFELAQEHGDQHAVALCLAQQAALARQRGDVGQAGPLYDEALKLHAQIGCRTGVIAALEGVGGVFASTDRGPAAARLLGAAAAQRVLYSYRSSARETTTVAADVALARELVGGEFDTLWTEGRQLTLEEAIAYAGRGRGPRRRPARGWGSLTNAELAVVRHVSEGLSNAEIGERLFVSPRTVGTHLAHIFDKVGVHSRRDLAREAKTREL